MESGYPLSRKIFYYAEQGAQTGFDSPFLRMRPSCVGEQFYANETTRLLVC